MALEDERDLVKATKKKNLNVIKDLQKQLQSSKRQVSDSCILNLLPFTIMFSLSIFAMLDAGV